MGTGLMVGGGGEGGRRRVHPSVHNADDPTHGKEKKKKQGGNQGGEEIHDSYITTVKTDRTDLEVDGTGHWPACSSRLDEPLPLLLLPLLGLGYS